MSDSILIYQDVTVAYGECLAVDKVSFHLGMGEVLCVVGESGSGKSSLIKAAMRLLGTHGSVVGGDIYYRHNSLLSMSDAYFREICGSELSVIFQDCLASFSPTRRIKDQYNDMLRAHNLQGNQEITQRFLDLLQRMNIAQPHRVWNLYPFELSGGMGQRIGIAMALAVNPQVVFADEPTSALDTLSQKQVLDELLLLKQSGCCALMLVTHNIALARRLADWIIVLKDGHAVEQGKAHEILNNPMHPYTQELLDSVLELEK